MLAASWKIIPSILYSLTEGLCFITQDKSPTFVIYMKMLPNLLQP